MTFPWRRKLPGLALLLAAALFAAASAATHVRAQDQTPLRTIIEVDGGRSSEMEFEVNPPSAAYLDENDEIEIALPSDFILPSPVAADKIGLSGSGDPRTANPIRPTAAAPISGNALTLTIPAGVADRVGTNEHLVITIERGSGIVAPETPVGFDDPDDGYPVTVTFIDVNNNAEEGVRVDAKDENIIVVKNPVSSTVPNARIRIELVTHAEAPIDGSQEITVDFSGPSPDSEFNLPSTITKTRITIRPAGESSFSPSDVLVQGARVNLTLPEDKSVPAGDYTISFSQLANIRNPFAAANRIITVSSFVPGDQLDEITAVILRTTTVSPLEGPRGSQFTLEGKGYAQGTVTIYHDEDGDQEIDPGETLDSKKTSRGAFTVKLNALGPFEVRDPEGGQEIRVYSVNTRDSNGVTDSAEFVITSSIEFQPASAKIGSKVTMTIFDWDDYEHDYVAAVSISGIPVFVADVSDEKGRYEGCYRIDDGYEIGDDRSVSLTFEIPAGVPPGEQTVSVFDVLELELRDYSPEGEPPAEPCPNGGGSSFNGRALIKEGATPITAATIEIGTQSLVITPETAVRGQRVTLRGSGFTRRVGGVNCPETGSASEICSITVNGVPVVEDLSQFEVAHDGSVSMTVTVPTGARTGENEVQVTGWDNTLGAGTLTVPAPSITLTPTQVQRGEQVTVRGSGFAANGTVLLDYGNETVGAGQSDGRGSFKLLFRVPLGVDIGQEYRVTAVMKMEGHDGLEASAAHSAPEATITTSPEWVSSGEVVTIRGENFPSFALVRPVRFGNREITPVPNISTDRNGSFEIEFEVQGIALGDQTLRVEVSGVVVTHVVEVAEPPLSGPPYRVFRDLIRSGVLLRVWYLERSTQQWYFFDPGPEFAEFSNLEQVPPGEVVWIHLSAPHEFQGKQLGPAGTPWASIN